MPEDFLTFAGERRRMTALPLGGIGTGNVALAATGALRQWQIHNQGNHLGALPQSLFAVRMACLEPPWVYRRLLQSRPLAPAAEPAPMVNDDRDGPFGSIAEQLSYPPVSDTVFRGDYPFAEVEYEDDWPARVELTAYTPFVPLDADDSGLPLASFTFRITNEFSHPVHGWLFGSLQNAVGWDGATPISGARCPILGGNRNRVADLAGGTAVLMSADGLVPTAPGSGGMALWTDAPAVPFPQYDDVAAAFTALDSLKLLTPVVLERWAPADVAAAVAALRPPVRWPTGPSPEGVTWSGGLAVPFYAEPGQAAELRLVLAWHFPNRYADFDRFGDSDQADWSAPLVGNAYAERYLDVESVLTDFAAREASLLASSRAWADALRDGDLPAPVRDTLSVQPALVRSPTTFRDSAGRFFGFEGVLGESTLNWNGNFGGSCPLNCTHVWNYEQAVAHLFPDLERTMRDTDWDVLQAPDGHLPHRVLLPLDGPQLHDRPIGGPTRPALDGMLGTVLKTYREVRNGAGPEWLDRRLPHARRLMEYVASTWDPAGTGLLTGDQPVTHDISLQGANMFVGGLWLAALRTMQVITERLGFDRESAQYGDRFALAQKAYDDLLWNGEYYAQRTAGDDFDFGTGCLSDQLFGQWWAHQLGLGHLLPEEHVRSALRAVVRHNLRHGFRGWDHGYRVFADADDSGLLICTWPRGGRPATPIRYADEVWTGVEYQVAAHCLYEGLVDEGLAVVRAVRARYDGTRRNPYNEIECGDHYSRAMSGWSLLAAWTGSTYDAWAGELTLGLRSRHEPLLAGTGWGVVDQPDAGDVTFSVLGGELNLSRIVLPDNELREVLVDEDVVQSVPVGAGALQLAAPRRIAHGQQLRLRRPASAPAS
jgi:uncharacterized protein (DUF608 family)